MSLIKDPVVGSTLGKNLKLPFFSIPPWEWYLGEIKTCQFWFSHSNPLPMGSSWAKKIFVKSLYGWDMALFSNFWQKPGLKWKISHHAAIFTVCNPDQSSYTISWTHIRCFWGTNKIFDFFRFPAINRDLSKNHVFSKMSKTEVIVTWFQKIWRLKAILSIYTKSYHVFRFGQITNRAPNGMESTGRKIDIFEKSVFGLL